ncbi:MAG: NUDIX domain-containing protein [Alphaproteobacteria bacterium]|nr:NUDIX domain-containing protein [Alphaproteobacteria bacterium]
MGEPDAIRAEAAAIKGAPPVPRDAATLILYRLDDDQPRILMGCRSAGHDFMPDKYVFPGGRVDDEDVLVRSLTELRPEQDEPLRVGAQRPTRAFPLTAIREMFEETGLIVGRTSDPMGEVPASWADYHAQGVAPCLQPFTFVGRAITPPMRHKRFDARFLMADARDALIDDREPVDGHELADLRWFTLKEAAELDLPNVTRFVISEIETRLLGQDAVRPFYLYWSQTGHVRERL